VSLITTSTLISLLRWHDHIPFTLYDVGRLFAKPGIDHQIAGELERSYTWQNELLGLATQILQIFDEMQRQQETSSPISAPMLSLLMHYQASQQGGKNHSEKDIEDVLAALSNRVFGILQKQKESDGYVLTLPVEEAARRIAALALVLAT
jgi:hypothetical protein